MAYATSRCVLPSPCTALRFATAGGLSRCARVLAQSCNHIGNEAVLDALCAPDASPCAGYATAPAVPWPSPTAAEGYHRKAGNLTYTTVLRTGHLVPTVVPKAFATLLTMVIGV